VDYLRFHSFPDWTVPRVDYQYNSDIEEKTKSGDYWTNVRMYWFGDKKPHHEKCKNHAFILKSLAFGKPEIRKSGRKDPKLCFVPSLLFRKLHYGNM